MIDRRENGRALQGSAPTVASERASAPNAATESTPPAVTWEVVMLHSADDFDRHVLPMGATPYDEPLICPCHSELHPCLDCRKDMDERATLTRLRTLREAEVYATDGEPRDYPEDLS